MVGLALIAAQCGSPAAPEPAPTATPASEAAPQATEEAAAEDESQAVVKEVVEESQAAKATELEAGVTVVSDEEVSSPRTKRGSVVANIAT